MTRRWFEQAIGDINAQLDAKSPQGGQVLLYIFRRRVYILCKAGLTRLIRRRSSLFSS